MADNKQVVTKSAGRALIAAVEGAHFKNDIPEIKSGDTVRLQVKVVEGSRERLQPFEGVVMRLRGGGINRNFTVRRITNGVGVERTFLIHSPRIDKIEVIRHARVRRQQLYYLRGLTGKAARLKELRPMTNKQLAAKEAARVARTQAQPTPIISPVISGNTTSTAPRTPVQSTPIISNVPATPDNTISTVTTTQVQSTPSISSVPATPDDTTSASE